MPRWKRSAMCRKTPSTVSNGSNEVRTTWAMNHTNSTTHPNCIAAVVLITQASMLTTGRRGRSGRPGGAAGRTAGWGEEADCGLSCEDGPYGDGGCGPGRAAPASPYGSVGCDPGGPATPDPGGVGGIAGPLVTPQP